MYCHRFPNVFVMLNANAIIYVIYLMWLYDKETGSSCYWIVIVIVVIWICIHCHHLCFNDILGIIFLNMWLLPKLDIILCTCVNDWLFRRFEWSKARCYIVLQDGLIITTWLSSCEMGNISTLYGIENQLIFNSHQSSLNCAPDDYVPHICLSTITTTIFNYYLYTCWVCR